MTSYINLGGKDRPILYGTLAFRWLKQESGILPADVVKALTEDRDFDVLIQLATFALRAGQMSVGEKPEPVDADTVSLWVDTSGDPIGTITKLSHLVAESMGLKASVDEAEGEAAEVGAKKKMG